MKSLRNSHQPNAVVKGSVEIEEENEKIKKVPVAQKEAITELFGKLKQDPELNKLMRSVLENDSSSIEKGKIIEAAFDQSIGAFSPDIMFEKMVRDFRTAKQLYGERLIQLLTGYDPNYVEKNIGVPEFRRELKTKIKDRVAELRNDQLVSKEGTVTDKGVTLASLVLCLEELDRLAPKSGWGEHVSEKKSVYGSAEGIKPFTKNDRYRDIAIKKSIKTAIRRGHQSLHEADLQSFKRRSKGTFEIMYAVDASVSMKGEKLSNAKKAGVALAYKAIQNKDKVGLLLFSDEVLAEVPPSLDFVRILNALTCVKASRQTNIAQTILKACELFGRNAAKHLIILTDAMPTAARSGDDPNKETINATGVAANYGITISVIGLGLTKEGAHLAEKIVDIGKGKCYTVTNAKDVDVIILEDYRGLRE